MSDKPTGAEPDFDAADLADAILGEPTTSPADTPEPARSTSAPNYLGPILVMLLGVAVALGIGLALQFDNHRSTPDPLGCDDLYASVSDDCCADDWVENWAPCRRICEPEPNPDGLFDAEAQFADGDRTWPDC